MLCISKFLTSTIAYDTNLEYYDMGGKMTHTDLRLQTGMKTSSVHMKFCFGCVSKRPDILMDICRHFISANVYIIFYYA